MDAYIDVAALTKVVVISLLVGAGVPALFAVGVRALTPVEGGARPPLRVTAAVVCFALCAAAVVAGVLKLVLAGH
ncbi:hypothetical protein [Cellulomonas sp. HZM]|uniref:hypothetical protein n=1 Tax=Cellulomonas sp. HZM TaxID=1454010 RepID=UPI0004939022|nr:hypothetical protein [Cellulomonas sp. HZM]